MKTNKTTEHADICEACGSQIEHAVFKERGFFGVAICRQTKCVDCAFQAECRQRTYKSRPYRVPGLRPKPDGRAPDAYVASFEACKAHRLKSSEGIES